MRLLFFSDIHGDLHALERLMDTEADYYFALGDMVSWARGLDAIGESLKRRAERTYVLPGNHEHERDIAALANKFGLHFLHGKSLEIGGYHVAGLGYSNPTPFNTPGEYTEDEIAGRLGRFAKLKPLILACHCAPWDTPLDKVHFGRHIGSTAIREFIDRHQPEHFICGHVHEAAGVVAALGSTRAANAGKEGYWLEL